MTQMTMTPQPIPLPANFPVLWEQPEDAQLFWEQESTHAPAPFSALNGSLSFTACEGFNRAARTLEMPIRLQFRHINTYLYQTILPVVPPEQMAEQGLKAEAALGQAMARLGSDWEQSYRPELEAHLAWWDAFDRQGASIDQLLAHLDESLQRQIRLWDIHFLVGFPFLLAPSLFEEMYCELFGADKKFEAYRLLQGFPTKTLEGDRMLWELSRQANQDQQVQNILAADGEALAVCSQLRQATPVFGAALDHYLQTFGQRCEMYLGFGEPGWIDDPTFVLATLRSYMSQPDRDLEQEQRSLVLEREQALLEVRQKLAGYPAAVIGQFEFLLKAAQDSTWLQEDHAYWIDQQGVYKLNRLMLAFADRFVAAGLLDSRYDISCLTLDELRATALESIDRHSLVAQRKAEMERFGAIEPPHVIGCLPPGPPPQDPMARAIGRFFGEPLPPVTEPGLIRGHAGSPGVVRGKARLVENLSQAHRLQPGEILITHATMPPWTPLFATAAAVVTDAGGVLSHCAVVAREYRIPAVVGTGQATRAIADGQLLEVDGSQGLVRILS